ncbi:MULTISPECIES: hypothetical protein [Lysinibacillus]|uniref:hypothetical protein n=1 Tax=Lysinibacillus TaxID=400634 RepID=UPI0025A151E6|nr:hypothetical protein [Lysinibacillus sphaericus]MDM5351555.1 hypothetical protein [Lysinibacillus sphaericus]
MGSRGTGEFGNYKSTAVEDLCDREIKNESLEDVSRLDYFQKINRVPDIMDEIRVLESLHQRRIVVQCVKTGNIIGYLPTKYSYLLSCMKRGISYVGKVEFSIDKPIPKVVVSIHAE